jgi:transposase
VAETEIISRRRKWTAEQKAVLLAEVEAEGGRVAMVARRHSLSESLLYNWRAASRAITSAGVPEPVQFVRVGVVDRIGEEPPALPAAPERSLATNERLVDRVSRSEIEFPNGVRVRADGLVNEKALSWVFRALKGVV